MSAAMSSADHARQTTLIEGSASGSTRIGGRPRALAIGLLWTVVALTLVTFVVSVPVRLAELRTPSAEVRAALEQVGIPVSLFASGSIVFEIAVMMAFAAIATVIFWQRSDDWMAIFMSGALVTYAAYITPPIDALFTVDSAWTVSARVVEVIGVSSAIIFFYLFPTGRFTPSWTRWLALLCIASGVGPAIIEVGGYNPFDPFTLPIAWFLILLGWFTTGLIAQIFRFRYGSTEFQRQQMKMVVFSTGVAVIAYAVVAAPRQLLILLGQSTATVSLYELIAMRLFLLTVLPIPFAFAFSILRYRLWDIDSLINRTIVYAALTAILAGLYTASIGLSQRLMVNVLNVNSDGPIVFTTLVVAAAFTPVRSSLQKTVDRYFAQAREPSLVLGAHTRQTESLHQLVHPRRLLETTLNETVRAYAASGGALRCDHDGHFVTTGKVEPSSWKPALTVTFHANGRQFGQVQLGPRRSGQAYSDVDESMIRETFEQVAQFVHPYVAPGGDATTAPSTPLSAESNPR